MLRDPLSWSLPLGRVFGITIRVHVFFVVVCVGLILHHALKPAPPGAAPLPPGRWLDMAIIFGLLFLSVLLHEFGHCFGARWVEGDAQEILLWPLGGLAYVEVPQNPRAHLITALCGPLVNVLLALGSATALILLYEKWPPLDPFNAPVRVSGETTLGMLLLRPWGGGEATFVGGVGLVLLAWTFWVNFILFLFNVILVGFPLDGGRILQAILWRYVGYRQAMLAAVFAGFITMFIVAMFSIIKESMLAMALAVYIYMSCRQEWMVLETGGEEGVFGYDFSQGYTSLERDQAGAAAGAEPILPRRRQSWWQRWQQKRNQKRIAREQEVREAEERRMDELLEKVQRDGVAALTEEEKRFMKRVSDRYRNRQ